MEAMIEGLGNPHAAQMAALVRDCEAGLPPVVPPTVPPVGLPPVVPTPPSSAVRDGQADIEDTGARPTFLEPVSCEPTGSVPASPQTEPVRRTRPSREMLLPSAELVESVRTTRVGVRRTDSHSRKRATQGVPRATKGVPKRAYP